MKRSITLAVLAGLLMISSVQADEKYNGGDGTEASPYQINTAEQLQQFSDTPEDWAAGKYTILTADIDLSDYDGREGGPGLVIIGYLVGDGFFGNFDGQGHTISGLTYTFENNEYPLGLFVTLEIGGVIKNLKLDNMYIEVDSRSAGMVAVNYGTITNCHVKGDIRIDHHDGVAGLVVGQNSGTVEDSTSQGACYGHYVGGLIGRNHVSEDNEVAVRNCSSSVDVSAGGYHLATAGGLVGFNENGVISSCSATGSVSSESIAGGLIGNNHEAAVSSSFASGRVTGYSIAGGLIGNNRYEISTLPVTNCYATGDVLAWSSYEDCYVGGLVGRGSSDIRDSSCYINCYAAGELLCYGYGYVGGLIGFDSGLFFSDSDGFFANCFWDVETTGASTAIGSNPSDGAAGLSTDVMQTRDTYISAGWDFVGEPENGDDDLWIMCDGHMYPAFARSIEGNVCDPYFTSEGSGTIEDPYRVSTVKNFVLIGNYPILWDKHFVLADNIDLTVDDPNDLENFNRIGTYETPFTGVFDGNGYSVEGLFFSSDDVDDVGMFGCIGEGGVVRDMSIVAAGIDSAGGINVGILAGINEGTVENCAVAGGMVMGNYATGGLVGLNLDYATISGCDSSADVIGTFSLTGGITGGNFGMVENSSSSALVTGKGKVGSIAGYNDLGVIENCYSKVGPEGITEVGGLVGRNYEGLITNCYSTGTPAGDSFVGALIGKDINGLGTFTGCFYDIDIDPNLLGTGSTETDPNGIIGETTENLMLASTYTGWDTTVWALRDNVGYPRLAWQLIPCDIAGSWNVNLADFQVLASNWLQDGFTSENANANGDFDVSGTVDAADLAILAQAWLDE